VGPTAVGKSEIAVEVALRCNAEIVGADAFQVYQGLDLLTAKPSPALCERVQHHLIGEISLDRKFDAALYGQMALERLRDIRLRGKLPLVVGGTGLYVRALTHGLSDLPEGNPELRAKIEEMTLDQLQEKYAELDPRGIERIDRRNRRRLVRAIEVSLLTGKPFSSLREDWSDKPPAVGSASGIVLERDREELYSRIDERVRRMFEDGVVEEVRAAGEVGPTASQAIGYAEITTHLRGEMTVKACIAAIQQRTRRYAKRQLTWLRSQKRFLQISLTKRPQNEVADFIAERITAGRGDTGQTQGIPAPTDV